MCWELDVMMCVCMKCVIDGSGESIWSAWIGSRVDGLQDCNYDLVCV